MSLNRTKFHHIGIAVDDIDAKRTFFEKIFDAKFSESVQIESQSVKVAFTDMHGMHLELIEASATHSPIFPLMEHPILSFLKKNGNGLHHICLEVDSIEDKLSYLKEQGISSLGNEIMEGYGSSRVIFLNPNDCHGLLIELRERNNE